VRLSRFQHISLGPEGLAPGLGAGERGVTGGGSFTCGLRAWTARLHNVANLLSSHSAVMPGLWARLAGNPDSPASSPSPSMMIACFGGYVKGPARSSTATSGSNSNRWHSKRTSIEWFPQCGARTVSVKTTARYRQRRRLALRTVPKKIVQKCHASVRQSGPEKHEVLPAGRLRQQPQCSGLTAGPVCCALFETLLPAW